MLWEEYIISKLLENIISRLLDNIIGELLDVSDYLDLSQRAIFNMFCVILNLLSFCFKCIELFCLTVEK